MKRRGLGGGPERDGDEMGRDTGTQNRREHLRRMKTDQRDGAKRSGEPVWRRLARCRLCPAGQPRPGAHQLENPDENGTVRALGCTAAVGETGGGNLEQWGGPPVGAWREPWRPLAGH